MTSLKSGTKLLAEDELEESESPPPQLAIVNKLNTNKKLLENTCIIKIAALSRFVGDFQQLFP